ncbi:hypothetical protein KUCAC02_014992, partial [Chaenocephalus aceratus]
DTSGDFFLLQPQSLQKTFSLNGEAVISPAPVGHPAAGRVTLCVKLWTHWEYVRYLTEVDERPQTVQGGRDGEFLTLKSETRTPQKVLNRYPLTKRHVPVDFSIDFLRSEVSGKINPAVNLCFLKTSCSRVKD